MPNHIAFAYPLTGSERGRLLEDDDAIAHALHAEAPAWLHLRADHPEADPWIDRHLSYLDPAIRDALTDMETRPRALRIGGGLLVILRGINLNHGEDPEDMVSLRLYIDPARIVSLSRRRLGSIDALSEAVGSGQGPTNSGTFLAQLVEALTDRIEEQVSDLDDRVEALEAKTIAQPHGELRTVVSGQRLELTELRRFLVPQRVAVADILRTDVGWLSEPDRTMLGEQLDQLTRVTETLDALREQLAAIRDEIEGARDERLNRNLYVLSVISAVFLPLGFLTGLMGINIAGMPGTDWPPAFWVFSGGLAVVTGVALVLLRRFRVL